MRPPRRSAASSHISGSSRGLRGGRRRSPKNPPRPRVPTGTMSRRKAGTGPSGKRINGGMRGGVSRSQAAARRRNKKRNR